MHSHSLVATMMSSSACAENSDAGNDHAMQIFKSLHGTSTEQQKQDIRSGSGISGAQQNNYNQHDRGTSKSSVQMVSIVYKFIALDDPELTFFEEEPEADEPDEVCFNAPAIYCSSEKWEQQPASSHMQTCVIGEEEGEKEGWLGEAMGLLKARKRRQGFTQIRNAPTNLLS